MMTIIRLLAVILVGATMVGCATGRNYTAAELFEQPHMKRYDEIASNPGLRKRLENAREIAAIERDVAGYGRDAAEMNAGATTAGVRAALAPAHGMLDAAGKLTDIGVGIERIQYLDERTNGAQAYRRQVIPQQANRLRAEAAYTDRDRPINIRQQTEIDHRRSGGFDDTLTSNIVYDGEATVNHVDRREGGHNDSFTYREETGHGSDGDAVMAALYGDNE